MRPSCCWSIPCHNQADARLCEADKAWSSKT
jgi:hypothetical protein